MTLKVRLGREEARMALVRQILKDLPEQRDLARPGFSTRDRRSVRRYIQKRLGRPS
jgi:hypothetical protein